jgi:hypothetical protein
MLLVVTVILMFVGGSAALIPGGLLRGRIDQQRIQAQHLAESGIEYALWQLRTNPTWSGDGPGINTPDLWVVEDQGNVAGRVRLGNGGFGQFRLRFNFHDGTPGADGRPNSDHPLLDIRRLSLNNLLGHYDRFTPETLSNGAAGTQPSHVVPPRSVWLCSEGRVGSALASLGEGPFHEPLSGSLTRVMLQAAFKLNGSDLPAGDAVAMANGGISFHLPPGAGKVELSSSVSSAIASIRSNQGIGVLNGDPTTNLLSANAEAHFNADASFVARAEHVKGIAQDTFTDFYKLTSSDVRRAGDDAGELPGGTYVVWDDGSLHYFDMSFAKYKEFVQDPANAAKPGKTPTLPAGTRLERTAAGYRLVIAEDLKVTSATNTSDLAIVPRAGAPEGPGSAGAISAPQTDWEQASVNLPVVNTSPGHWKITDPSFVSLFEKVVTWGHSNRTLVENLTAGEMETSCQQPTYFITLGAGYETFGSYVEVQAPSYHTWDYQAPGIGQMFHLWATHTGNEADPDYVAVGKLLGLQSGSQGTLPNAASDTLTPSNLTVAFEPKGSYAVLSSSGNVALGTGLSGRGGSIVSDGNIQIVGMGVDLEANPNQQEGVSLYAQGNIYLNSFQQTSPTGETVTGTYRDIHLKGVVYSCGNITAQLGDSSQPADNWGRFNLQGCLVAYGEQPANGAPNVEVSKGLFDCHAGNATLRFDPSYLQNLRSGFGPDIKLLRFFWSAE